MALTSEDWKPLSKVTANQVVNHILNIPREKADNRAFTENKRKLKIFRK